MSEQRHARALLKVAAMSRETDLVYSHDLQRGVCCSRGTWMTPSGATWPGGMSRMPKRSWTPAKATLWIARDGCCLRYWCSALSCIPPLVFDSSSFLGTLAESMSLVSALFLVAYLNGEFSRKQARQFSLQDLFVATTLIAAGVIGQISVARRGWPTEVETHGIAFHAWTLIDMGSIALIGLGLGTPFHQRIIGVVLAYSLYGVWITWHL